VLKSAVNDGVRRVLIVGCGSDTRPYRFQKLLRGKGVRVLECDQPEAIRVKEEMGKRWHPSDYVDYLPIDLNDGAWPRIEQWLESHREQETLVLIEGVSAYVDESHFCHFLEVLAAKLSPSSYVCYDYKTRGINDELGRGGRTRKPFRLSDVRQEVAAFHLGRGLQLQHMELSSDLCSRLLPELATSAIPFFAEDVLVQLVVPASELSRKH
jgi:O-methyltransferase involved in polyketide biosynthesis